MILYANGCSHTAGAEAVVSAAFAEDDGKYRHLGRRPHPLNLAASWCTHLAGDLNRELICDAESASGNDRIIRTTLDWLRKNPDKHRETFMIIQWTTWEREEWLYNGTYYQVNASGIDIVPQALQEAYRHYIIGVDWTVKTLEWHNKIWEFHCTLNSFGIPHLFYNGHSTFSDLQHQHDWGSTYINPYSKEYSWNSVLEKNGFTHVTPRSFHFGADGHCFWSKYLLQYITDNKLL